MTDRWPQEDPYAPRPTRLHQLIRPAGWTLKLYGISYGRRAVDERLLTAASSAAATVLPAADKPDVFGIGFVIAHQGQHAEWVLIDWWQAGGILAQRIVSRPYGSDDPLAQAPPHLLACVWELRITTFERDAWVKFVLAQPSRPNFSAYLDAAVGNE